MAQRNICVPLAAERGGKLPALGRMERFPEKENLIGRRYQFAEVFRFRAQRSGHNHDVDVRVDFPDLLRRLDTIDPRRHFDVQKNDGKRAASFDSFLNGLHGRLALAARVDIEFRCAFFVGIIAE